MSRLKSGPGTGNLAGHRPGCGLDDTFLDAVATLEEAAEKTALAIEEQRFGGHGGFPFAVELRRAVQNLRKA